jgi:hypothetical protein
MKIKVSHWLLVAIVAIGVPFWWLLVDTDRGVAPPKPIHIADLRALAAAQPGQHPVNLTYTLLATRMIPGDYFAAGIGLKLRPLSIIAWSLEVPGKTPIMIDPAGSSFPGSVGKFLNFDFTAQNRLIAETKVASMVLYTQGNESEPPRPTYQLGKAGSAVGPAPLPASLPVSYTTAQAIAPGVVVIPASSHAPGARLIFVKLADGREYLFAGSIATVRENWLRLRPRSHLAAILGPTQDRDETYAWLRTIHQLKNESPTMKVVPGHDYAWLARQLQKHTVLEYHPEPTPVPANAAPLVTAR